MSGFELLLCTSLLDCRPAPQPIEPLKSSKDWVSSGVLNPLFNGIYMVDYYTIPFTYLLFVLLLDFRSCTGLVSRDKIPQVITRFYLSPHSPPTFKVLLTRFGSLISPYVPFGFQSCSALWLQLCNIWAS